MRWSLYPAYKNADVEWLREIPKHWEVKRLKAILLRNDGGVWGDDFDDDGTIVLRSTEQTVDGGWRIEAPAVRALSCQDRASALLLEGDLLITKSSGSEMHIGKTTIVTAEIEALRCCFSNFMQRLRVNRSCVPRFFYYILNSPIGREQMVYGSNTTTGLANLTAGNLGNIWIAFPAFDEQKAIATFLDRETERIDTLIVKKERQIELLQEKRAALISHAVTKGLNPDAKMKDSGIEWLGEIPMYWELVPLKFLVVPRGDAVKTGPFGSQLLSSEMLSGTVKVYNQRNVLDRDFQTGENYVTDEKHAELRAFTICSGDLLITTRGTIGHCALFPPDAEPGILHPCLMRVQPDSRKIIPEYLAMLIQDSFLIKNQLALMSNATTIEVIYSDSLKRVKVPIPPVAEQKMILLAIGCKVGSLDKLSKIVEKSINILREYRAALISAMITGKIDVRKEVA